MKLRKTLEVISAIVCFSCLISCSEEIKPSELSLIPAVNQLQFYEDGFSIDSQTIIAYSPEAIAEASFLKEMISDQLGLELKLLEHKRGEPLLNSIFLNLVKGVPISEKYALQINEDHIWILSDGNPGLFYGIQTLHQILDSNSADSNLLPSLKIEDHPEFGHRGLLLDCSRHFMSVDYVKATLDRMAYYKMNTLHWHLTEDQGWRIEIEAYPLLTEIGAWRTEEDGSRYGGFYSKDEVREIVRYAAERHISVIPEIEMPGHSSAAISAYPWLSCTGESIAVETEWGVFQDIYCAGNDSVFSFLETVLAEVSELFPGVYIHIGGDEAPKTRWENCDKCQKRIADENLKDEHELQSYFINRIGEFLNAKGKRIIGWDEILEGGIPARASIQSWRGMQGGIDAVREGHEAIMSPTSHCYFDYDLEAIDVRKVYEFDPVPPGLSDAEQALILGAEGNMWSERVTEETIDQKIYPRLIALAEVLWSYPSQRNYPDFIERLRNHYPRLKQRGVNYGLESLPVTVESAVSGDSLRIQLQPGTSGLELFYSTDSGNTWLAYTEPFGISKELELRAKASLNGNVYGEFVTADLVMHRGVGKEFEIASTYSPYYPGGGANGLLNGRRGTLNFRDGQWQGRQGTDLMIKVDLGEIQTIESVSASFYQYTNAWIFLPSEVVFSFSEDGNEWSDQLILSPAELEFEKKQFIENFELHSLDVRCRFIRMTAKNFGLTPEWHDAPGMESWLFCDELIIR